MDPRADFGTSEGRRILLLPRIEPKYHGVSTSSLIRTSTELSLLPFFFRVLEFRSCDNVG
jgi:hypothetical protein